MTRVELRDYVEEQASLHNIPYHVYATLIDGIDTLKQESVDYKTQYESYLKKSKVVISQLRADRDRLLAAFDKMRAEIETKYGHCDICEYFEDYDYEENDISEYRPIGDIADVLQIIGKYKSESKVGE